MPVLQTVSLEKVGLERHKQECDRNSDAKVEISERSTNIAQAIIHHKHSEYTIEIEEQQSIREAVV